MSDSMKPVVMISGASRGIGAAAALAMLDAGWAVSLGMRDTSVSKFSGASVLNCRYDALDPGSEKEWVAETISHFGGIDGLVLNAGIMMKRTVLEATDEDFDMMFAVNVKSPMRLSQLAWPHLQKKPGRIVVMSSLSGKRVRSAGAGLYGMSKFALTALSQALRQCGKESGIRSTAICPSYVATDMAQGLVSASEEELTRPEDIAILIRTILSLPPSASIAEVPVNWTVEECY